MDTADRKVGYASYGNIHLKLIARDGRLVECSFADPCLDRARKQLEEYLAGNRKVFSVDLELTGTPFQKKVWAELLKIPYGQTASYKDIARRIGHQRSYRAVGGAVHNNPVAIIVPCHRVIGSDGSLTGFAGGLELKKMLLDLESRQAGKA
jgi:methylated-DNA-[protein]-cysteine S-methyltransferase